MQHLAWRCVYGRMAILSILFSLTLTGLSATNNDYYKRNEDGTYSAYYKGALGYATLKKGSWEMYAPAHPTWSTVVTYGGMAYYSLENYLSTMSIEATWFIWKYNVSNRTSWPWIIGWHFQFDLLGTFVRPSGRLIGHQTVPTGFDFWATQERCDKTHYTCYQLNADFHGQTGLTGLTIPPGMYPSFYSSPSFYGCTNFKTLECSIDFFESINTLFDANNHTLESVKFYPSETGVCQGLSGITSLKTLDAPVARVGYNACANCVGLMNVNLGPSTREIGSEAFKGCSSLKHIDLPPSLERIGYYAFQGSGLEDLTVPDSVRFLGTDFAATSSLRTMRIGSGVTNDFQITCGGNLERLAIGDCSAGVWVVGDGQSSRLNQLEIGAREVLGVTVGRELLFSDNVQSIDSSYIGDSDVRSVVFGKGLTSISGAIRGKETLKTLIFNGDAPQYCHMSLLVNTPTNTIVYVRRGSTGWNGPGSTDLPARWPTGVSTYYSRRIRYLGDDEDAGSFRILDVWCDYCRGKYGREGGQRATFLAGVPVSLKFHIEYDGGTSGKGIHHFEYGLYNTMLSTFEFDPGSLATGAQLTVVGVADDGTRTKPFRVNFDVADQPEGLAKFHLAAYGESITYRAANFSTLDIFGNKLNSADFTFGDKKVPCSWSPSVGMDATVDSTSGQLTLEMFGGVGVDPLKGLEGRKGILGRLATTGITGELKAAPKREWDPIGRQWMKVSESLGLRVACETLEIKYRFPQLLWLGYLGFRLRGVGDLSGTYAYDEGFSFSANFDPLFSAEGLGGLGALATGAEAGVFGGIYLSANAPPAAITGFGYKGGAWVKLQAFSVELKRREVDWTQQLYPATRRALARLRASSVEQASVIPRVDVEPWACAERIGALDLTGGAAEHVVYATDYQWTHPALASADGTNCILFVTDAKNRNAANRGILMSAIGESADYVVKAVWDDNTADCRPSVAVGSTGILFATWMNAARAYEPDEDAQEQFFGSEIAVGARLMSGGEWVCTNITADAAFDRNPKVCSGKDGGACVAWVKSPDSQLFGSEESPDAVMACRYENNAWTEPTAFLTSGHVESVDVKCDGNGTYYAVFAEINDAGECNICLLDIGGGVLTRLANIPFEGVSPKLFVRPDGSAAVMWYADGRLKSRSISGEEIAIATPAWNIESGDFDLLNDGTGRLAMMWIDSDAYGMADANTAVVSHYDFALSKWSSPTPIVCNSTRTERMVQATFDGTDVIFAYESILRDDATDASNDITDIRVLARKHGPDVAVLTQGVSFSEDSVFEPGGRATVVARVVNLGDQPVDDVPVRIFVGKDESSMSPLSASGRTVSIPVGGFIDVSESFNFGSYAGDLVVKVVVDGENVFPDVNRDNNVACRHSLAVPMLSAPHVESVSKFLRRVSVSVPNIGFRDVPAGSVVTFRLGGPAGEILGTQTLGALASSNEKSVCASVMVDVSSSRFTNACEIIHMRYSPPSDVTLSPNAYWDAVVRVVVPHWVRFDASGGTVSEDGDWYEPGMCYGFLPTPQKDERDFGGWYTEPNGRGTLVDVDSVVTSECTVLYAYWIQESASLVVTFDLDGKGRRTGGGELVQNVKNGSFAEKPTVEAEGDFIFIGWDKSVDVAITDTVTFVACYASRYQEVVIDDGRGNLVTNRVEYGTLFDFAAPDPYYDNNGGIAREQYVCQGSSYTAPVITNAFSVAITNGTQVTWDVWQTNYWFSLIVNMNGIFVDSIYGWKAAGSVIRIAWSDAERCTGLLGDVGGCATNATTLFVPMSGPRSIIITLSSNSDDPDDLFPKIADDPDAVVTGDVESGYTITPSEGKKIVEVTIPVGVEPEKVTVVLGSDVETVKPNGANVKIMKGTNDITGYLDIPAADTSGTVDLTEAAVKEEIVRETLDPEKGAKIVLDPEAPKLTTSKTKSGLTYTLKEGRTLKDMASGDSKLGDGQPWTPNLTIKGGKSGFYSIGVTK